MNDRKCPCGCGVLVDVNGHPLAPPAPALPDLPIVTPGMRWAPPPVVVVPMFAPNQPPIMFTEVSIRCVTAGRAAAANLGFVPWGAA